MGFGATTFWQHAYMSANPDVGSISTSTAGFVVHLVVFLAGAMIVSTPSCSVWGVIHEPDAETP